MEKVIKKFYDKLRSGEDIRKESQLSFDEIINKYYNLSEEKLDKNHICILRDLCNNDKEFDEVIFFYRNISEDSKIINYNKPCDNCSLNCCNNIDVSFNFYVAVFIMDLFNRRFSYNAEINKELTNLFFKQFYIEEDKVKFNEEKMINLFIDYDLEILDNELLKNDSLSNVKMLLNLKNHLSSLENRYNSLSNDNSNEIRTQINFVSSKLEYYKNIYDIEKEERLIVEKKVKEVKHKELRPLEDLWLPNAKISLEKVIEIGIQYRIWDEDRNIITKRSTDFSTGKSLLASLSVALKNYCYPDTIHPDILGKAFCKVFNVKVNLKVSEPYKSFTSANSKITKEFRRILNIRENSVQIKKTY